MVAVRNRHRATPDRLVDPRDARQFSVGAANGHRSTADDTRDGAVVGVDQNLGCFAEKIELSIQLSALPARHHHQRWRWLQRGELIDEQRRRQPPTAHPLDVVIDPLRG